MLGMARQRILGHSLQKIFPAAQELIRGYSSASKDAIFKRQVRETQNFAKEQFDNPAKDQYSELNTGDARMHCIGENVSRKDKIKFLVTTLLDLKDCKEAVYGTLDAWVAWEKDFPISSLKKAISDLEKLQQWHRVIQVIKWMLSKGQGNTMGTYGQLIRALDMDRRADEAHKFWMKKIGSDLHSVPWQLCNIMISVYYRNNMLDHLIKLFRGIEAFDRKPPAKSIVQKVANAYEMRGFLEEKERVLEKYKDLFTETGKERDKSEASLKQKRKTGKAWDKTKASSKQERKSEGRRHEATADDCAGIANGTEI